MQKTEDRAVFLKFQKDEATAGLSLGVAALSFGIGILVRRFPGVEI